MELKVIDKERLLSFVNRLLGDREVVGVKKREGGKYIFDRLENPEELCLDYDVTLLPPKKYFLPRRETPIRFKGREEIYPREVWHDWLCELRLMCLCLPG